MRMPFGKHRGASISALPDSYLNWLFHAGLDVDYPLRRAIEHEWIRRFGDYRRTHSGARDEPKPILTAAAADMPLVLEIIDRGYRAIALKIHPDTGGSTAAMKRLNNIVAALRAQIAVASR
jgi:hypothetical protein